MPPSLSRLFLVFSIFSGRLALALGCKGHCAAAPLDKGAAKDSPVNDTSEAVNVDTEQFFLSAWH